MGAIFGAQRLIAAACLSFFSVVTGLLYYCLAPPSQLAARQKPSRPPQSSENPSALKDKKAPFDKLELFGRFAAGPIAPYASRVIQERGCNFTPDAAFINAFSTPAFQAIL